MDVLFFSEVSPPNVLGIFMFIFGTVVGSFLNVVVFRLGTGERMGNVRSRCFSCGTQLQWYDLIPLVSFLLQGGKCRYCGSKISWQYPVVETASGAVFVLVALHILQNFQFSIFNELIFKFLYFVVIFSLLLAISVYDFRHKIIPNQLVYPFIILSFFYSIIQNSEFIIQNVVLHTIAGVSAFVFFASLWFFSRGRWMGFGDAKLALGIGFFLGPPQTLFAVVLSFWIGTLIAVPIVLWKGGGLKAQIPFGPFLAAGCFIAWFAGDLIGRWYGF